MSKLLFCHGCIFFTCLLFSQENYEIQVYGSKTMQKRNTIFELHSNFTNRKKK